MTADQTGAPTEAPALEALIPALVEWLPGQRWFAAKGRAIAARARSSATRTSPRPTPSPAVAHAVIAVEFADGGPEDWFQLLLGSRPGLKGDLEHAVIGTAGGRIVYDGLADGEISRLLLSMIVSDTTVGSLRFVPEPDTEAPIVGPGRPLLGEQSNSSVIYGERAILKLFRRATAGLNPDLELHRALGREHSQEVAPLLGAIEGELPDEAGGHRPDVGGDAAGLRVELRRRLGDGPDQRARPARRGRPASRRGRRRLRRRGHAAGQDGGRGAQRARPGPRDHPARGRRGARGRRLDARPARPRRGRGPGGRRAPRRDRRGARGRQLRRLDRAGGAADPRRPAPGPGAAHAARLVGHRLRGRAVPAAERPGPAGLPACATWPRCSARSTTPRSTSSPSGSRAPGTRPRRRRTCSGAPRSGPTATGRRSATATPPSPGPTRAPTSRCCAPTSSTRPCTRCSTRPATGPHWLAIPLRSMERLITGP